MRKTSGRRLQNVLAAVICAALTFSGCGLSPAAGGTDGEDTVIRISMYNDIAYSAWRTYVEEQCPDITFVWENNRNSTRNLIYQAEHGDMADIVTIRRFENDSAAELAPYLLDLGGAPLTATFSSGALEPFTFGGKVCWYPAPGMIECLYANVSLFRRCGLQVPATVGQLEEVCRQFRELGIDGLSLDVSGSFRCTYLLEGFCRDVYFASAEGQAWLTSFLAGETTELPAAGGARVASRLRELCESGVLEAQDLTTAAADAMSAFDSEKAAMIPNGSDHTYTGKAGTDYTVIPCLGATEEDQILYTYPIFSAAVSKAVEEDAAKKAAVEQVLQVMYSSEAQQILADGTEALLSYNDGIELPVSGLYQSVSGLIADKRCFIRFLNRNMFAASAGAMRDIAENGASDTVFTEDFNQALSLPLDTTVIGTSAVEAGNQMGAERPLERAAASVIAQAAQAGTGADAALIEAKSAAAPIYKGDYTASDLNAVVADEKLYEAALTGAQLQDVFNDVILATTTYRYLDIEPVVDYPALAGLKAFLSADGTKSTLLLPDGKAPDPDAVYRVVVSQTILAALTYLRSENAAAFSPLEATLQSTFREALAAGTLQAPAPYFEVEAAS